MRRSLRTNEIRSFVAAVKPYLSTKHVTARLSWRTERENWTTQLWDAVAFNDDSSFTLLRPRTIHVCREKLGQVAKPTKLILSLSPVMHCCVYGA